MTVAHVRGGLQQLEDFRRALLLEDFVVASETETELQLQRRVRILRDDWPIRLMIQKQGDRLKISYFMYIPWAWIALFCAMVIAFLPIAGAMGAPPTLLLSLGLLVIVLATVKQKFDFSPDASWQGPPRRRWNETMNRLIGKHFEECGS
jgi:hypothetical protein